MARYIDADALKWRHIPLTIQPEEFVTKSDIEKAPTADVVEVVRCKECIYWNRNYCHNTMRYYGTKIFTQEDDFCSRGERWKHAKD